MKPRRVVLTVEVETNAPLKVLGDAYSYGVKTPSGDLRLPYLMVYDDNLDAIEVRVHQVSVNVIREKKRKGKR